MILSSAFLDNLQRIHGNSALHADLLYLPSNQAERRTPQPSGLRDWEIGLCGFADFPKPFPEPTRTHFPLGSLQIQ